VQNDNPVVSDHVIPLDRYPSSYPVRGRLLLAPLARCHRPHGRALRALARGQGRPGGLSAGRHLVGLRGGPDRDHQPGDRRPAGVFLIRPAKVAFKDFMDPSVMFIFASIVIGLVFTKTGLTRRMAYKMLIIVGERTSMIYLGCFVVTAALTHIMAHTAVAATIYPLLMAIYALYGEGDKKTKFGKGLFIGMAYVAGAGSIITLLGAARGAVAIGFFNDIVGKRLLFRALLLHVPRRLADGLPALGLFHDFSQAGKEGDPRPARQSHPAQRRAGRRSPARRSSRW
jgi:hypothetical protein